MEKAIYFVGCMIILIAVIGKVVETVSKAKCKATKKSEIVVNAGLGLYVGMVYTGGMLIVGYPVDVARTVLFLAMFGVGAVYFLRSIATADREVEKRVLQPWIWFTGFTGLGTFAPIGFCELMLKLETMGAGKRIQEMLSRFVRMIPYVLPHILLIVVVIALVLALFVVFVDVGASKEEKEEKEEVNAQ